MPRKFPQSASKHSQLSLSLSFRRERALSFWLPSLAVARPRAFRNGEGSKRIEARARPARSALHCRPSSAMRREGDDKSSEEDDKMEQQILFEQEQYLAFDFDPTGVGAILVEPVQGVGDHSRALAGQGGPVPPQ